MALRALSVSGYFNDTAKICVKDFLTTTALTQVNISPHY